MILLEFATYNRKAKQQKYLSVTLHCIDPEMDDDYFLFIFLFISKILSI